MKLTILERNLTFSQALEAVKEGQWIKCPEWEGYWFLKGGKIQVMNHNGEVGGEPWLREQPYILREDWQVVKIDEAWQKEESDKRMKALRDVVLDSPNCSLRPGTPVQDNSFAFIEWLKSQEIEFEPSGHQTIIIGHRDMFEIGRAWATYKIKNLQNKKSDGNESKIPTPHNPK